MRIDGRRSRGERFLHGVKEVMRKWKEREVVGDRRGYVFDEISQYGREAGEEEEEGDELSHTGSVPLGGDKWTFTQSRMKKPQNACQFQKEM